MDKMTRSYNGQKDKTIRWLQGQDHVMVKRTRPCNGQKDKTIQWTK